MDYISREAAIAKLCADCDVCQGDKSGCAEYCFIMSIPAADVREVNRGKWERKEGAGQYYEVRCSVCGSRPPQDYAGWVVESNYCPSCGADMREVTE